MYGPTDTAGKNILDEEIEAHRELKRLTQDHTMHQGQSQGVNPGVLTFWSIPQAHSLAILLNLRPVREKVN